MAEIELHFTEFFDGETVLVSNDSGELYRGERLKTDMRKSLAKIVRIDVPSGRSTLRFEMPAKALSMELEVDASRLHHIGVSLLNGELRVNAISREEFKREPRGYL